MKQKKNTYFGPVELHKFSCYSFTKINNTKEIFKFKKAGGSNKWEIISNIEKNKFKGLYSIYKMFPQ